MVSSKFIQLSKMRLAYIGPSNLLHLDQITPDKAQEAIKWGFGKCCLAIVTTNLKRNDLIVHANGDGIRISVVSGSG